MYEKRGKGVLEKGIYGVKGTCVRNDLVRGDDRAEESSGHRRLCCWDNLKFAKSCRVLGHHFHIYRVKGRHVRNDLAEEGRERRLCCAAWLPGIIQKLQ